MSKKLFTFLFIFSIFASFYSFGISPKGVSATVPCPEGGCPKGGCNYQGCGDNCHCRGGACGDWNTVCTWCDPNDCEDVFGDGWKKGGCTGGSNCREKSFSCNCNNGSHTCHKDGDGPDEPEEPEEPTSPPKPTNPPSPTPVQPTETIDFPLPSPKSFSQKALTANKNADAQNWICLNTIPCASGKVTCSGGDPEHRVRISTKDDKKMVPNKKTYIFECLQTSQGYRCTTGNGTLDEELLGVNHLPDLSYEYGYTFSNYTTFDGKEITQSNPDEVVTSDGEGNIGPLEWESSTTLQVGRVMMGMQSLIDGDGFGGEHGTQKQGTFVFGEESNETICVMIKWDPHGTVFDSVTLAPLDGVKVTLYRKGDNNSYTLMDGKELFGGLTNPVITGKDGAFAFYVPNGTYKLKVEKEGYEPLLIPSALEAKAHGKYPQIYDGGDIVTQGRLELRNIAMRKITLLNTSVRILQNVLRQVGDALK